MIHAIRNLNQRGQHNWTKIICLAIGLAAGVVLIGKVGLEQSWDDFFPESDRIYMVCESTIVDGEYKQFPQTAGAVAPGIKRYCPQVEAATRYTWIMEMALVVTDDDERVRANVALVDSCFFDVFPFRIIAGDPKQALSQLQYCMVSQSLAEKLGGDVVGKKIYYKKRDGWTLTIGGVYEDIPLNSKLNGLEIMVSLPTINQIMWYGTDNWVGNDRYQSYVRLVKGTTPDDLKPQLRKMENENIPEEEMKKAGVKLEFFLQPLLDYHTKDENTRRMTWILSLLATVLIGCAVMNYLLLVVGGISRRAREMAVRKCYGAENRNLYAQVLSESVLHLLLSLALAAGLLFVAKDIVEQITSAPLDVLLLAGNNVWMIVLTSLVVLLITGLVPGWIYTHIPVAAAFKNYSQSHRLWKLLLLGLQFASATFLIVLLAVVGRQYQLMVNDNPGYDYSTLGVIDGNDLSAQERQLVVDELRKLSVVKGVTASSEMLTSHQSGDNIFLPDDERQYINVANLYWMGNGYFDVMGIPVVSGRTFTEQTDTLAEVMVSRRFEERMQELAGWDQAVGKQIHVTSFNGYHTIVGVYEDPRIGSITNPDTRPSVCFYSQKPEYLPDILVRFHSMDGMEAVNKRLHELIPHNPDVVVTPYSLVMTELYTDAHRFRTTVMIGGLVALLVALIGLVGYLAGEIGRRQKEIAIRKVNGAQTQEVLRLFVTDILRVALPAIVVGIVTSWYVARQWLEQFSEKTSLSPLLFAGCALLVLIIILAVVYTCCRRISTSNPVDYLKDE